MAEIQNWSTIRKVVPRPGVSQRVLLGKQCMMALNEFAPGTSGKLHSHPQEQLVFLMEGEADLVLGNQTLAMKAGDVAVVASDVPHTLQVKGTKACTSLEIFSPIPDKFLSPPK